MYTSLMVFHAVISILLIISVLLQFGKGAEAGLMSGGASDAVFSGAQQGNILTKITTILTIIFVGNCIILAKVQSGKESKSLMDSEAPIAAPLNSDAAKTPAPAAAKPVETTTPAPAAK